MPRRTFSCFLIGGNSLLVSCAELLLEQGHEVLGVVSPDEGIRDWAARQGLDAVDADQDLTAYLSARPFDYLFSVANLRMLPEAVLSLPRELPVNFHDAPLPRHAGLNATTWAILGGETLHGVSWHVMTERADAGDLLARREVPVSERDTSHTLNVKCLEAGVESFAELIEDLALGRAERHPQNPAGRNYHGRFDRPAGGGFLSWDRTPQELDATVRAMEFGPHPNAFGTAKIACDDGPVLVYGSEILPHSSRRAPGTVVETGDDGIVVATTGRDLRLTGLTTPTGRPLPAAALAARRIRPGHRLPAADAPLLEAASGAQRRSLRDEAFWVRRLSRLTPADLPHRRTSPTGTDGTPLRHLVPVPDDGDRAAHATGLDRAQWLLTASLAFLARLGVESGTDVRLLHTGHLTGHPVVDALYAPAVPLRVPEVADRTMSACGTEVVRELEAAVRRGGPAHDLATRHRALRERRPALTDLPLAVELTEDMTEPAAPPAGAALLIRIPLRDGPCQWVFAEDAFGHEEAVLTAEHAAAFLHAAAHAPHAELDGIALGSDARRAELAAWNDTATDFPLDLCVHQMVTRQARLRPDAPAVVCGGRTLTYGDLDRRSSDLAGLLRARGAGPGTRVGVCLSRSPELVVALLAVMKSGAAYVPLDPLYPAERIAYMATDTALPLLITDPGAARGLPALTAGLLLLDRDRPATAAYAPEPGADVASGTDAYVIYTSGSTGHPKGVRISHRALTNFVCAMSDAPGFTDRDRLLAVTTVCFDIAGLELYLPLVTGGQVEIASAGTAADGFRLRELLESSLPTVMQATPATWRMLIEAGWRGQPHGAPLRILCGGERLPTDLADALLSRGARLWNMYGPTETTIWSAVTPVTSAERTSIGRPIANTRLHVLDARRRPLPTGVPGELYIGGEGWPSAPPARTPPCSTPWTRP
ncbi:AMP-binding protein [Streptomyces sp. NPDC053079]|uniref:AMP-binding protein n=1 Tax=Streptomyces sp. NPDC053079 TaxID=3365697 RepID=UPI0037D6AEED